MECAARDADGDRNRAALAEVIEWPVVCLENAANARARPTRVGVSEVVGRALDVSPHHGMGERDAYSVVPSGWHGTLIGKPPTGVQKTPMRAQEVAPVANSWEHGLQDPIRRHGRGFDTLDHEPDYWLPASGPWSVKDDERCPADTLHIPAYRGQYLPRPCEIRSQSPGSLSGSRAYPGRHMSSTRFARARIRAAAVVPALALAAAGVAAAGTSGGAAAAPSNAAATTPSAGDDYYINYVAPRAEKSSDFDPKIDRKTGVDLEGEVTGRAVAGLCRRPQARRGATRPRRASWPSSRPSRSRPAEPAGRSRASTRAPRPRRPPSC